MAIKRSVIVEVPDVEAMTDEQLSEFARDRDGRWSEQTKKLLQRFNADRLDLNCWWAATWTGWSCPCCRRTKPEIARVGSNGVLLCRLEMHHDHLGDHARKLFDGLNPKVDGDGLLNEQIANAKDALLIFVERFGATIICADCNAADGEAKRLLAGQIDPNFTFTPAEISEFIRAVPNTLHEVNLRVANELWLNAKDDFADRVDFSRRMATRFADGKHRRDQSRRTVVIPFEDRYFFLTQIRAALPQLYEKTLSTLLDARSISNDGAGQSIRPKRLKPKRVLSPTDAEFEAIVSAMPQGRGTWDAVGDDWKCECCGRNKREICRKSNKGSWMAQVHRVRVWSMEIDPRNLQLRKQDSTSSITIGTHRYAFICHDCKNIVTKVQHRAHGTMNEDCLTTEDITAVIASVVAHRDHKVDFEEAMKRAESNHSLMDAARDYDRHRNTARNAAGRVSRLVRFGGFSRVDAITIIVGEVAEGHSLGWDDATDHVHWLLDEAKRFDELEADER